jgi:hypothetical protein
MEREMEADLARLRPAVGAIAPQELLRLAFRAGQAAAAADASQRTAAEGRDSTLSSEVPAVADNPPAFVRSAGFSPYLSPDGEIRAEARTTNEEQPQTDGPSPTLGIRHPLVDVVRYRRKLVLWRAAAAALVGGLGISLLSRPAPHVVERERVKVVYLERPAGPSAAETPAVAHHGDPRTGPDARARSPLPLEADAAAHSSLPEFLATSDSPSRPLIPAADADYLSVRDAVLRLGVRVIPSPRAGAPRGGPVTLETLLGPSAPAPAAPARRGGVGAGLDEIRKFLTGGQT